MSASDPQGAVPLPLVESIADLNALAQVLAVFVIKELGRPELKKCPWCKCRQLDGEAKHHDVECPAVMVVDMVGRNLWDTV